MPTSFNEHSKDDYTIVKETWKEQFARDFTTLVFPGESFDESTQLALDYFTNFFETQIKIATRKVPFEIYEEISNRIAKTNADSPRYWELRTLLDFIILFEKENS